jgi:glucosylceramidase
MIGKFTSGCDNYAYWNMLLDENQKSGWGWAQNSLATIDRPSGTVRFNPDFQPVCLVSQVIRPGFVRIGAVFQGAQGSKFSTPVAAFQSPKGEIVVLAQNRGGEPAVLNLKLDKQTVRTVLPANADCAITLEPSASSGISLTDLK